MDPENNISPESQPELFFCETLPRPPQPEVLRETISATIEEILAGPAEILFLDGADGGGKTTLLSHFVRSRYRQCFAIFIRSLSRWACDPFLLQNDLAGQILWRLEGQEIRIDDPNPEATFRNCVQRLKKAAARTSKPYYVIIDGLAGLRDVDAEAQKTILETLPTGLNGIKLIISGPHQSFPELTSFPHKDFYIPLFELNESSQLLSGLSLKEEDVMSLHKLCGRNPGKLAAVRRQLEGAKDIGAVLQAMPDHLPNIFEMDWKAALALSEEELRCLAILTHEKLSHTPESLAVVSSLETPKVEALVNKLSFLELETPKRHIVFRSDGHRAFAARKLNDLHDYATDRVIAHLLSNDDTRDALLALPLYLNERHRFDDLLAYLTPAHVHRMVEITKSWKTAQKHTHLGVEVACALSKIPDAIRLSLQEATLLQLDEAESWRPEIEASIAVGDYRRARSLADAAVTHEERLHLLCIIERSRRERGDPEDPELVSEVKSCFQSLDLSMIGEKGVSVAVDLLHVNPDLAIDLLKAASSRADHQEDREQALAHFTMEAFNLGRRTGNTDFFTLIVSRLDDPTVASFSTAAPWVMGGMSAKAVRKDIEKIEKSEARIAMLRLWCRQQAQREDAHEIAAFGLEQVLQATDFSPTARVWRELATPLLFTVDTFTTMQLVERFAAHRGTAQRLGPTQEYARFQLTLACAELRFSEDAAISRLTELFFVCAECDDIGVRASCCAHALDMLAEFDVANISGNAGLIGDFEKEFNKCVDELLAKTARHFQTIKSVIRALSRASWSKASELANKLNTEERRDKARFEVVRCGAGRRLSKEDIHGLLAVAKRIRQPNLRNAAVMQLVERVCRNERVASLIGTVKSHLLSSIREMDNLVEQCRALCLTFSALATHTNLVSDERSAFLSDIKSRLDLIDVGWVKVATGFNIARSLAEHSRDEAVVMIENVRRLSTEVKVNIPASGETLMLCLRLCTQAFGAVVAAGKANSDWEAQMLNLVARINSSGLRAELIADMALAYFTSGEHDLGRNLVARELRPLLQHIELADGRHRALAIRYCASALYRTHALHALEIFATLDGVDREAAFRSIIWQMLTDQRPVDPFEEGDEHAFTVEYERLLDVVDVAKHLDQDHCIYEVVKYVVDTVSAKKHRQKFSYQQKEALRQRLAALIRSKMPSKDGVPHDGYVIVCEAYLSRIGQMNDNEWEILISRARAIPNVADVSYVLAVCGRLMPTRLNVEKKRVFEESFSVAQTIPTLQDRLDHLEMLAMESRGDDLPFAKKCIKTALLGGGWS